MSGDRKDEPYARGDLEPQRKYASDYHAPVLCNAVVEGLISKPDGLYVDGTLGGGGHAAALLDALESSGRVVAIDRDPEAVEYSAHRLKKDADEGRLILVKGNFGDVSTLLSGEGIEQISGLLLDLGVSSHQLDEAERGFSHRLDGPLDMRMDRSAAESAAEFLNMRDYREIVRVLRVFGEQPSAARIAKSIVAARPLNTTRDLVEAVGRAVPAHRLRKALARTFQAIRIAVNGELEDLERALLSASRLLETGGRVAVISYHSLEDRRVKRFFRSGNFEGIVTRDVYGSKECPWTELTRSPIVPSEEETASNPRSRSARLRIAEKRPDSVND